ncbi:mas-related G-protein coupled receptor member A6-like [Toxotes jaculatrix]|uniref:mas-related G-protein coupled receptor member A6-like n=1 Tax=Toxotes jaculatrix TaxID=941984 RepID=UPI001B3AB04C|nr:mas-related G-protein coupled receptor member A6-like [Toxotes jaculatrix]
MEDFYNTTSQNSSYEYDGEELGITDVIYVTNWIVLCIGLPLTILAIYGLYSLVRTNHVAPIYVINLLISDLILFCCMIVWLTGPETPETIILHYSYKVATIALMASVGFMTCVAVERYLLIAWPLWYRFKRSIKVSVVVCVMVWVSTLIFVVLMDLASYFLYILFSSIYFLLPFPVLIFSLAGTFKALSAATSVSSEEKRRIVGALILVLLNYTLLFLPTIIWFLSENVRYEVTLNNLAQTMIRISPLADLVLYVFMRKGAFDRLLACLCCCKSETQQTSGQTITVSDDVES